jgi:hypothetical protein
MFSSCRHILLAAATALFIGSCATSPSASSDAGIAAKLGPGAPLSPLYRAVLPLDGAYVWGWQAGTGGLYTMLRRAATSPPMAAADHVNLFAPGYQATAEAWFSVAMDGYQRCQALHPAA